MKHESHLQPPNSKETSPFFFHRLPSHDFLFDCSSSKNSLHHTFTSSHVTSKMEVNKGSKFVVVFVVNQHFLWLKRLIDRGSMDLGGFSHKFWIWWKISVSQLFSSSSSSMVNQWELTENWWNWEIVSFPPIFNHLLLPFFDVKIHWLPI